MAISILEHSKETVNIVATTVVEKDGNYLMIQESKSAIYGKWNFPSGKADLGETIFESAIRETKEETGQDIELVGLREMAYEQWQGGDGVGVRFVFQGKIKEEVDSPLAKDVLKMEWKTPKEMQQLKDEGKLRNFFTERLVERVLENSPVYPLEMVYCFTNDFKSGNRMVA